MKMRALCSFETSGYIELPAIQSNRILRAVEASTLALTVLVQNSKLAMESPRPAEIRMFNESPSPKIVKCELN